MGSTIIRVYTVCVKNRVKLLPLYSITGLTADARVLIRFMRTECRHEHFAHDQSLSLNKLMERVGMKMQVATQRYDKRPYGVGLLIAGYDVS